VSYDVYSQAYLTVAVFVFVAVGMVALMLGLASLLRPSLPSESKLTPYESGVDPVPGFGQAHVRYYIYALLFVIFDIEAAFVFPWATEEPLTWLLNYSRKYSLWIFQWGLACCAIEMGAALASPRYDLMRLGVIPFPASPRQADLVCISGTVTDKMAPAVKRLYDQMPDPKYVISMGSCANCGGPYWDSYSVTKGIDQIIPVDVYVPGCPPRPEALIEGVVLLQQMIQNEEPGNAWRQREPIVVE
jgi:NADH-quinone oxidoreductase subunit B